MSALWWIPLALGAATSVMLCAGGRRIARELAALRASTADLGRLRAHVTDVRLVAERTRRAVQKNDLQ